MKIKYRRIFVDVPIEKPKVCPCCSITPKPRGMNLHHWKYEFKTKEVRENPLLALKNTTWLCYSCHRVADAMRVCLDSDKMFDLMLLRSRSI